jgi:hypothetical protein
LSKAADRCSATVSRHRRQLVEAYPATVRERDFHRAKLFGTADGSDGSHRLFGAADIGAAA